ncbi:MAG: RhuM family protein [Desulfomicrobium sp.]
MQQRSSATEPAAVAVYQSDDGAIVLRVPMEHETVWLNANQMSELFGRDKSVISRHVRNVFSEGELEQGATVANFATVQDEGGRNVSRNLAHYNLDVIISVGYRVKSPQGVRFRQWATRVLREHLVQGYTINRKRLSENARELQKALELVQRSAGNVRHVQEGRGLVDIVSRYTRTFLWLQQYDEGRLSEPEGQPGGKLTPLAEAQSALAELKRKLVEREEASNLFGLDRGEGLTAIWGALEQSAFGEAAYPTMESKAAHLLYFMVKNHPFMDGNKRSAAFLFVRFLHENGRLFDSEGLPVMNETGLAALTLLVAESDPREKDTVIRLIGNLLSRKAE